MLFHKKETKEHIFILALCAFIFLLSLLFSINKENKVCLLHFKAHPLPEMCFFKKVVGIDCPFCGMTRSFVSMSHLDFRRAWEFNRIGIFIYALVILQIPYRSAIIIRRFLSVEVAYGRH